VLLAHGASHQSLVSSDRWQVINKLGHFELCGQEFRISIGNYYLFTMKGVAESTQPSLTSALNLSLTFKSARGPRNEPRILSCPSSHSDSLIAKLSCDLSPYVSYVQYLKSTLVRFPFPDRVGCLRSTHYDFILPVSQLGAHIEKWCSGLLAC